MLKLDLQEKKINQGLLGLFILFGLYCAIKATRGLILPVEQDDFRDMSIAENMLHGLYLKDPTYQNELLWYNPLLPAIDAFVCRITGLPMNIVVTHIGKFFSPLIPISIYYMGLKLFNPKIALATAVACMFFVCGNEYAEHTSGYTYIWLALCFSQVPFYLIIAFTNKTLPGNKNLNYLLLGFFAGILFLVHSAPSFLFCIVLICCFLHAFIKKEISFKQLITRGLLFSFALLLTGSPLLYSVFVHYHYHIKNVDPMQWVAFILEPEQASILFKETVNVYFVIAMVGLVCLIKNKTLPQIAKRIVLYWVFCSAAIFFYVYSIVFLRTKYNIILPGFVPSSDAFFCVKSAESILFGIGFWQIITWVFSRWGGKLKLSYLAIFYAVLMVMVAVRAPRYYRRKEFTLLRTNTLEKQQGAYADMNIYTWLKKNTDINDVVLCKMDQAIFPVMASGRKMVVANTYYSSPYISYLDRKADADSMLAGLNTNNNLQPAFDKYNVKYILLPVSEQQAYPQAPVYFPDVVYTDSSFIVRKRHSAQ